MHATSRRCFLSTVGLGAAALGAQPVLCTAAAAPAAKQGRDVAFGLVTYQWAKDWDLPTLIGYCEKAKVLGVELRTTHEHGVEPDLGPAERAEVKKRFADSQVTLVGLGSNERFDHPDPDALKQAVEATKAFVRLSHDVGGSGVKVKPNDLPKDVPPEKTIAQIGKTLAEVAEFADGYGQQIRMEVHGQCSDLEIMKKIMDAADHPNAVLCWNSNQTDLKGKGLAHNFGLVKDRFGATVHVRPLDTPGYPWQELIALLVKMDYRGWVLLEAGGEAKDPVTDLTRQRRLFEKMVAEAQA